VFCSGHEVGHIELQQAPWQVYAHTRRELLLLALLRIDPQALRSSNDSRSNDCHRKYKEHHNEGAHQQRIVLNKQPIDRSNGHSLVVVVVVDAAIAVVVVTRLVRYECRTQ